MDKEVKEEMESTCKELGMTMSTAFNIFARKMAREKRIPFDVSIDPFYSENNTKTINELKEMEDE
jgi:DNA-damage-inducible protein J